GAAVRRLHDAGPAARGDDVVALAVPVLHGPAALGGDAAEAARLLVPAGAAGELLAFALADRLVLGGILERPCPRGAEDDDGRAHAPVAQRLLRLGVFEQEAHAAHRIAE